MVHDMSYYNYGQYVPGAGDGHRPQPDQPQTELWRLEAVLPPHQEHGLPHMCRVAPVTHS